MTLRTNQILRSDPNANHVATSSITKSPWNQERMLLRFGSFLSAPAYSTSCGNCTSVQPKRIMLLFDMMSCFLPQYMEKCHGCHPEMCVSLRARIGNPSANTLNQMAYTIGIHADIRFPRSYEGIIHNSSCEDTLVIYNPMPLGCPRQQPRRCDIEPVDHA